MFPPQWFSEYHIDLRLFFGLTWIFSTCILMSYICLYIKMYVWTSLLRFFHRFGQGKAQAYKNIQVNTYTHTHRPIALSLFPSVSNTHTNMEQQGKIFGVLLLYNHCIAAKSYRFITQSTLWRCFYATNNKNAVHWFWWENISRTHGPGYYIQTIFD